MLLGALPDDGQRIGHGNRDPIALDHDLATSHWPVVGKDPDLVVLVCVKLDYGATAHPQKLLHGNDGPPKDDGDLDFDGCYGAHGLFCAPGLAA